MNTYANLKLKKVIDYYFAVNGDVLPSISFLSKELNITVSELRTILAYFVECNYLYRNGNGYNIFKTKQQFTKHTSIIDKGGYVYYLNPNYSIAFSKVEMIFLEPNFNIETIQDLIYMLFLFTMENKVLIKPIIYEKNSSFWYKKECRLFNSDSILYMCEFTQNKNKITLINE